MTRKILFGPKSPGMRTGFHSRNKAIARRGLSALDKRSREFKSSSRLTDSLLDDLGGRANLSTQVLLIVEMIAVTRVLLTATDNWLRDHADLIVNKRRKTLAPIVAERTRLSSHLLALLQSLGLERKAPPVLTLSEVMKISMKEAEPAAETVATTKEPTS